MATEKRDRKWQFWIDRGGTFTDIVAQKPDGAIAIHKLLSEHPDRYQDAPLQGIRDLMGLASDEPIPAQEIAAVKMGTTVATNALLERKGDRTVLLITKGFRDLLRIGYQNRPDIFARQIILPEMLYERMIEVDERFDAQGNVLRSLHLDGAWATELQAAYDAGIRACAVVLMHGYRYPQHEQQVAQVVQDMGFTQVSVSHQVSPLMKIVSRGDTTVMDAYLSPILRRYVDRIAAELAAEEQGLRLMFMQSNGGLTDAHLFQGKDSILSGPAGGIVGAVQTSLQAGFERIIGFDMGGTSTDVSHYRGEYERTFETEVAGVRLRAPMMSIHTVAAGGGSLLVFDGARYRVGPDSAGAYPGPACYRNGGPLAVTDCNVMLGKLQPEFFPAVFGTEGNLPLDREIVIQQFKELAAQIEQATSDRKPLAEIAQGFLDIAIDNMASAIKKISTQRGYDVSEYTLCCFGGAGGQHACLIADALGMKQIFIHPYAGVLSAYGMGLADIRVLREQAVEAALTDAVMPKLEQLIEQLTQAGRQELEQQGFDANSSERIQVQPKLHLKYEGTDSPLIVDFGTEDEVRSRFEAAHRQRYGFIVPQKALIVESVSVEVIGVMPSPGMPNVEAQRETPLIPVAQVLVYMAHAWRDTPVYQRPDLRAGDVLTGPALIIESTGTNVLELGWQAELTDQGALVMRKVQVADVSDIQSQLGTSNQYPPSISATTAPDPVMLEIFNNLFRAVAEEMGVTLQNTSYSVNIKERLDFSCAIFDQNGQLVANAPHIPVHLGSMGESVQSLIRDRVSTLQPGDVYMLNNPYNGGTHLPDVTVITPVFAQPSPIHPSTHSPIFYVASRGHHADIGGITPGSMPPNSTSIHEEGVLIDQFQLVAQGQFQATELENLLTTGAYPVRNFKQNLADLQAQIAANEKGVAELLKMVDHYGLATVQTYMQHVQNNAEESVRRAIAQLCQTFQGNTSTFTYPMDNGAQVQVTVTLDADSRSAVIDFAGTSPQLESNFNAPVAVCKAAVLYVFRTLVDDNIPLNAGCLKPLDIRIPVGCLLNPQPPAAVVAGNVETSQVVTDALYGALGVLAGSQGTMNNFTFGNERYQYYETICGGSGAGQNFDGTDAVHTHMTNSRLTDPEVLEWRFPVLLEQFSIRPNSGGNGQQRGGNGIVRQIQFQEMMTAAILSNHRQVQPFGLAGGEPGQTGRNAVRRADGTIEELDGIAIATLNPGDTFIIETPGGGGFGAA